MNMKARYLNGVRILVCLLVLLPSVVFAGATLQVKGVAGISIWMNNKLIGETVKEDGGLIVMNLAAGEYELKAAKQGYEPVKKALTAVNDQTIEWRITLQEPVLKAEDAVIRLESSMIRSGSVGTIVVRSIPLNAEVFLDGKSLGVTDRKLLYVPAAKHEVKLVFQGRELVAALDLQKGETHFLTADFQQGKIKSQTMMVASELGPEIIKLQSSRKRKPALFPHRQHQEMWGCETCHHGKDSEGNQTPYAEGMKIQHCVTCHNPTSMKNKKLNNLMLVAHARCKGCHKKIVEEEGKSAGPIAKCSGCHITGKE
jgi:hypothetical protein